MAKIQKVDLRDETAYLGAVRHIIADGTAEDGERTGVGTLKLVGVQLRFALRGEAGLATVPALTCRRLGLRWIAEELLWFIRGSTDATELSRRGVHIWDDNTTAEFIGKRGLTEKVAPGHIGPGYGWQWRRGGRPYGNTSEGVDQLAVAFATLRHDPGSRRILVNSWDVQQLALMVLPPCHYSFQFVTSVTSDADAAGGAGGDAARRTVSCVVTMRSGDFGLGIPFNAVSYALLTHLAAAYADMVPGEVVINVSDAHVYTNHVEVLTAGRHDPLRPRAAPPGVVLGEGVAALLADRVGADDAATAAGFLDAVGKMSAAEAFAFSGYAPGPRVKMEMAV